MSVRTNEGRLGIDPDLFEEENDKTKEAPPPTSSLKFVTPTEFVELPSRGHFYGPDHPLHQQQVVEIKHMTTKEEDILTSMALLKQGVALDRMLENVVVDPKVKVENLLLGDKNALIIATRIHGYGPEYNTSLKCPSCGELQSYSFNLESLNSQFPTEEALKEYNIEISSTGTFLIALPKTDYTVEARLISSSEEKKITDAQAYKKKKNFPETPITDLLRIIIVSVNGISDPGALGEFIATLPAIHARYIRRVYDKLVPSIDMKHSFVCADCNHEGTVEVPLNTDFFWSNA
jgi:transcription elongation factor Elf1